VPNQRAKARFTPFTDGGTQAAADEHKQICAHNSYLAPWALLLGVISRERGYGRTIDLNESRPLGFVLPCSLRCIAGALRKCDVVISDNFLDDPFWIWASPYGA
jgi:hypothetical protein